MNSPTDVPYLTPVMLIVGCKSGCSWIRITLGDGFSGAHLVTGPNRIVGFFGNAAEADRAFMKEIRNVSGN